MARIAFITACSVWGWGAAVCAIEEPQVVPLAQPPAAVATAVTAYCIDGLRSVPCPPIVGIVEGLFEGDGRATWAVYDDSAVTGRRRLNLTKLSPDLEVLDVMGNDPRATGKTEWEIGIQPLFVMSPKLEPAELLVLTRAAVH